MGRDSFHETSLLKALSNLAFNTPREGAATASLGNLCQGLTILIAKNFFLIEQNISTAQDLQLWSSPTTWPLQGASGHFISAAVVHHWKSIHQSNGPTCIPAAARQSGSGQLTSKGFARFPELGHWWRARGTPPLTAKGDGLVASKVYVVVEYTKSGGRMCNSHYSLLFSSGIPPRIVPLKRRFVQMATMCINQKNMEYWCLWVVPSKDNSSKEKIFFHCLTSYLWSTPCPWSQRTLANTVITARRSNQRSTPRLSKRTAWTPLASPPNCHQWRAPAFRNDSDHADVFLKKDCRVFSFSCSDISNFFEYISMEPHFSLQCFVPVRDECPEAFLKNCLSIVLFGKEGLSKKILTNFIRDPPLPWWL